MGTSEQHTQFKKVGIKKRKSQKRQTQRDLGVFIAMWRDKQQ